MQQSRDSTYPPTELVACPHATLHKNFSSQFWFCMIIFFNNKEDEHSPPIDLVACSHATLHGYSLRILAYE